MKIRSLLVVLGSSDGHVLRYLDKQTCKSRSGPFIEVTDFDALNSELLKLFKDHGIDDKEANELFDNVTGGRLTDIYKAIQLHERLTKEKKYPHEIKQEIINAFENEMKQALNKAMENPRDRLQLKIARIVIDKSEQPTVHDLALKLVLEGAAPSIPVVMKAIQDFVEHNILRYNVNQQLEPHSLMARKVLKDRINLLSDPSRCKMAVVHTTEEK